MARGVTGTGRELTRAVVSCLRCSEPNLVGGLPRCGCFVHALIVAPTSSAIAILDSAPLRPRRPRVSAAARARNRGVLARDAITRYNSPPRWFTPAEPVRTGAPAAFAFSLPVYADDKVRTRSDRAASSSQDAACGNEIVRGGRRLFKACTLTVEPSATLQELQAQLQAAHGIRCSALGRARAWAAPSVGDASKDEAAAASGGEREPVLELHGLDGILVELPRAQLGCTAWPFFAQPGDVLCAW